jgi:hypothetical protein
MTSLILPDIHHHTERADRIIKAEPVDQIIFLGDYFDDFHDTALTAKNTALWLKDSLTKPNRIHLMGNHDLPYRYCNPFISCSGYTSEKDDAINRVLNASDWDKLEFYTFVDGWMLSHAGLDNWLLRSKRVSVENVEEYLKIENARALKAGHSRQNHWFFQCGRARGGMNETGGLMWCDANREFTPTAGLKQIFGHTPQFNASLNKYYPRLIDETNLALDTTGQCYAIMRNGEVTIKEYKNL